MSSAILYLAIVAIWGLVLVPYWLRRQPPVPDDWSEDAEQVDGDEAQDSQAMPAVGGRRSPDRSGHQSSPTRESAARKTHQHAPSAGRKTHQHPPGAARSQVLRARQIILGLLLLAAAGAAASTMLRLTHWWVCVPAVVLLGGYLILLRDAARADTELEQRRSERARSALRDGARLADLARRHQAKVGPPVPTAPIIDLSARRRDQVYDQYEDAAVVAVGD